MEPAEVKRRRFKRGEVEVVVRSHYKGRQPDSSHVCLACVRKAVNEPDAVAASVPPAGMVKLGGGGGDSTEVEGTLGEGPGHEGEPGAVGAPGLDSSNLEALKVVPGRGGFVRDEITCSEPK